MSNYPPSHFADQSGYDQDNLLDPSIFDESNFDYLFAENGAPAYQDGQGSDSNAITETTEDTSSGHEEPQAGLTNEEPGLEIDYDELRREQEAIARMLQMNATEEPSSFDDATKSLAGTQQEPQYEVEEAVEDQGRPSKLQSTIFENKFANHGQQPVVLPNEDHQEQVESNAFGEVHEGMRIPHRTDPGNDSFNFDQSQLGLLNAGLPAGFDPEQYRKEREELASASLQHGQSEFQFDFGFPDSRSDPVNYPITGESSSLPDTVADNEQRVQKRLQKAKQTASSKPKDHHHRPAVQKQMKPAYHASSPQGEHDKSAAGQIVENGEGSKVNTPGVDSGYGTLNPSPEATDPASSGQNINTDNEGGQKVKKGRAEAEPNFDPANDLNHYPEDPETRVVESRRREGWGRTGTRRGVEVVRHFSELLALLLPFTPFYSSNIVHYSNLSLKLFMLTPKFASGSIQILENGVSCDFPNPYLNDRMKLMMFSGVRFTPQL